MEKPSLNDPNEYPEDAVLKRHLGEAKTTWDIFIGILENAYPLFSTEWRYYKDGGSWLFKITKKKKTISWVTVFKGYFKTTFYFTEKAGDLLNNSGLRQEYIDQFTHGKSFGKIKAITVNIRQSSDLEMTKILIGIKEKIK